jgi:hypothetical protein
LSLVVRQTLKAFQSEVNRIRGNNVDHGNDVTFLFCSSGSTRWRKARHSKPPELSLPAA